MRVLVSGAEQRRSVQEGGWGCSDDKAERQNVTLSPRGWAEL